MPEPWLGPWHVVARDCGASKAEHTYMRHYEALLAGLSNQRINLLEIGICNGGSLATWLNLFPHAHIFGVDVVNNVKWFHERVTIRLCDQADPRLGTLFPPESLDVIIDDGSHVLEHQTRARESLWPALKPGGWYFIEDIINLNDLRYWGTFGRFRVFMDYLRRSDRVQHSLDDVLVVLRKEPCSMPWEW